MHDHFWPDIDEALNALYPELWQSWSQSHTPHFFSINDSSGLFPGRRQPWGPHSQQQSNLLSMDYFDCCCCSLTYYLIVVEDTSILFMLRDLHIRYRCVQNFNSLGEYLWVCKGWVFVRRFIVAGWLRYMLLITSDLTPHKTGNMSSMPQNYLHSYSMLQTTITGLI